MTDPAPCSRIAVTSSVGNLAGFVSPCVIGWIIDQTGSTDLGILLVPTLPRQPVNR